MTHLAHSAFRHRMCLHNAIAIITTISNIGSGGYDAVKSFINQGDDYDSKI